MTDVTPEKAWWEPFLAALERTGNVSAAAAVAKVSRWHAYRTREESESFRAAWDEALDVATDALEAEARRRALEGTERARKSIRFGTDADGRPIYELVTEREYSDTLMIFLLKAHRPEKFRDNVTHEHGGEVTFRLEYADDFTPPSAPRSADDPP